MAVKNTLKCIVVCLVTIFVASCSNNEYNQSDAGTRTNKQFNPRLAQSESSYEAQASGFVDDGEISGTEVSGASKDLLNENDSVQQAKNVFYFEYNQSLVRVKDYDALYAHAQHLATNPERMVHIIGHADERGTPEYNLALGEQRANAIADILLLQGIRKDQMTIVSYGEEAPVALGHNEEAWVLNRRAELIY